MKTHHIALSLLAATAMLGQGAAQAADTGGYVGGGVGQSSFDINGSELDALLADDGITATTSVDDSDTAWKLFGGYRMHPNFGVEVAYVDYGTPTTQSTVTAPSVGTVNIDMDVTAWTFDAVAFLPLGGGFELFGKAGAALWDIDAGVSGTGGGGAFGGSADDDGSDFHFGVGASYAFTDNFRIRAEWERINADDDLDVWTVSAVLGF
ncbi:MAG: outer membrane beta-barrel protein [Gammaproteobacteria bacterium]|nr:outer membrane beta-barrel protein [Gammaproteobacteria bacterium]